METTLGRAASRLRARLPGARSGHVEDVHQARVAIRRLRSDLRTFGELVDEDWAGDRRRHLAALGDALGHIRDLDVLELTLERLAAQRPELEIDLSCLRPGLARERAEARQGLELVLDDPWLAEWLARPEGDNEPVPLRGRAQRPADEVLPELVRRPWRRLARAVDELAEDPDDAELHRLRILVKRCRYAVDAARPAVGRRARRLSDRLGNLQDVLGDLHDAAVIADRLRAAAQEQPGLGFTAGQLTVLLSEQAARCRREWPDAWAAASRPKLLRWF